MDTLPNVQPPRQTCPACGAACRPDAHFCSRCGHAFAPAPPTYVLIVEDGPAVSRVLIPTGTVTVGRAADCTVPLSDPTVSRNHLRLTWDGAVFHVEDLGSRAGTRLNGAPLAGAPRLQLGDTLSLGNSVRLRLADVSAHVEPAPVGSAPPVNAMPAAQTLPPAAAPARHSRAWMIVLAGLVLLASAVVAAVMLLPGLLRDSIATLAPPNATVQTTDGQVSPTDTLSPTATPAEAPLILTVAQAPGLAVPADGQTHSDEHGVSLTTPADQPDGEALTLSGGQAAGPLAEALGQMYTVETGYYAVTGAQDTRGVATLALPAAGPDSRVAVVIDGSYVTVLDVAPDNGVLQVGAFVSPDQASESAPFGVTRGGSRHYLVIGPAAGSAVPEPGAALYRQFLSAPVAHAADAYRNCLGYPKPAAAGYSTVPLVEHCRTNAAGTIHVTWSSALAFQSDSADTIIGTVEQIMQAYSGLSFTAANLQASAPMIMVVDATVDAPQYNPKNGVIYLPRDTASNAAGGEARRELAHELFHWIEDEEYLATIAALSGPKSWWLEVAAENAVFLIDNQALELNLTKYGQVAVHDSLLGLQAAPYAWAWSEEARYVQAQLLKVNMCDSDTCPISQAGFVAAINAGTYPFDSDSARAQLTRNLDDYARYLLGVAPQQANTAIPLGPTVSAGGEYGDTIQVSRTTRSEFDLSSSSYPPQIVTETPKDGAPGLKIEAVIEADGVYPLRVANGATAPGAKGPAPSWPVMLSIEPGVELYYRLGGDAPVYHDGGAPLVLGPIHQTAGYPAVRLVAIGRGEARTFKATVQVIDLRGDWLLIPGDVRSNSVQCASTDDDAEVNPSELSKLIQLLATTMAPKGSYVATGPNELAFEFEPGAVLADDMEPGTEIEGIGLIGPDNIQGMLRFYVPPPADAATPAPLMLAAVPVGLAAWRMRRSTARAIAIVLLGLLLAGCVGITMYGSIDTRYSLEKLEYIGKGDAPGEPIWRISQGTATTDIDLTIVVEVAPVGEETEPTVEQTTCSGKIVYDMVVEVYKDGVITPEEDS